MSLGGWAVGERVAVLAFFLVIARVEEELSELSSLSEVLTPSPTVSRVLHGSVIVNRIFAVSTFWNNVLGHAAKAAINAKRPVGTGPA